MISAFAGCSDASIPGRILPLQPSPATLIIGHWNKWQEQEKRFNAAVEEMGKNTWLGDPAVYENYYQSLLTLDASQCPADYQQAWQEYVFVVRELSEHSKANVGTVGFASQAVASFATGGISGFASAAAILDASERRTSCWGRLKAIAVKYGVTFN